MKVFSPNENKHYEITEDRHGWFSIPDGDRIEFKLVDTYDGRFLQMRTITDGNYIGGELHIEIEEFLNGIGYYAT